MITLNNKSNQIMCFVVLCFVVFVGCSRDSPEQIATDYIKGVQKFDARTVWEKSRIDFLDETLLSEEKEAKFKNFKAKFDKRDFNIFKLFPSSATVDVFAEKAVDEKNVDVFVKVVYLEDEPYQIDKLKSATTIKIKINVRSHKNGKYVKSLDIDSIIVYNKHFDFNKLKKDLTGLSESDPEKAYTQSVDILKKEKNYFAGIEKLSNDLRVAYEKHKKKILSEELLCNADNHLLVKGQSVNYNTSSYKTEDTYYSTHDDNITYHHRSPGRTVTKLYGVTIYGKIGSKFKQRTVKTEVTIRARSKEGKNCALLGCVYWGNKEIYDSFIVEVPPQGISFSKYYNLETGITKSSGIGGAISRAFSVMTGKTGTYLEDRPEITLSKTDEEKKTEGKAVWGRKSGEIYLAFKNTNKVNSDSTISAKDKLAKWNRFYKLVEEDIYGINKDDEYRKEAKKNILYWQWAIAAPEIKTAYAKAMAIDNDENSAANLKYDAWSKFLNSFQKDYMGTDEDDELRKKAKIRKEYWEWEKDKIEVLAWYDNAIIIDNDENSAANLKYDAWSKFLNSFRKEYVGTDEDDELRKKAKIRKEYWSYSELAKRLQVDIMIIDKDEKLPAKMKLAAWKNHKEKLMFHYPKLALENDIYIKTSDDRIKCWKWAVEEPAVKRKFNVVMEQDKSRTIPPAKKISLWKNFEKHLTNSPKNNAYSKTAQKRILYWSPSAIAKRKEISRTVRVSKDKRFVEFIEGYTLDKKTGTMWLLNQKVYCYWHETPVAIRKINKSKPAGYSDWTMPSESDFLTLLGAYKRRGWRNYTSDRFDPVLKKILDSNTTLITTSYKIIHKNFGHFWTNTRKGRKWVRTFFYIQSNRSYNKYWILKSSGIDITKKHPEKGFIILIRR